MDLDVSKLEKKNMLPLISKTRKCKTILDPFEISQFVFFFGGGGWEGFFFFRSSPMKFDVSEISYTKACLSHSSQE